MILAFNEESERIAALKKFEDATRGLFEKRGLSDEDRAIAKRSFEMWHGFNVNGYLGQPLPDKEDAA